MAVDTRQKRASATSLITIARIPGVDNTSLDQAQRQASIWSYSGILAGAAIIQAPTGRVRDIGARGKIRDIGARGKIRDIGLG